MIDLQELQRMRATIDKVRKDRDRAQFALEQAKQKLLEEFGCEDIEEALALQKKLAEECMEIEDEYAIALRAFKSTWKDVIK